jgi:hypothetical protein
MLSHTPPALTQTIGANYDPGFSRIKPALRLQSDQQGGKYKRYLATHEAVGAYTLLIILDNSDNGIASEAGATRRQRFISRILQMVT